MSDLDTRNRIVDKASEHFLKFGFSRVTMSDIATELGMSKKTVYTYFPSKEDLLAAMMDGMHQEIAGKIDSLVADQDMDFIQKILLLLDASAEYHTKINSHFLLDIQKSAPEIGKICDKFRGEHLPTVVSRLVEEGIQKNIFRKDIDKELVILMYIGAFQFLLQPERLSQLPFTARQILQAIGKIMLEGILTVDGRDRMAFLGDETILMTY